MARDNSEAGKAKAKALAERFNVVRDSMLNDMGEIFRELKKDLSAYVELKLELLKLNTYERTGKVIAVLSYLSLIHIFKR